MQKVGQTKWMYFLIEDDDLLEKYNISWDKHPRLDFFLSSRQDKDNSKIKNIVSGDAPTSAHASMVGTSIISCIPGFSS